MPTVAPPSPRTPKALKTILVVHLLVGLAFVVLAWLWRPWWRDSPAGTSPKADQKKRDALIAQEQDVERLRAMARDAWAQSDRGWEVKAGLWHAFEDGMSGIAALSLSTVFVAWWGLTRRRGKAEPSVH